MTTLADAPFGAPLTVVANSAGQTLDRRLAMLGIRSGATVTIVSKTTGGGRVVFVAGARVALGRAALGQVRVAGQPA